MAALASRSSAAAARIAVLVQELGGSPAALEYLTTDGYSDANRAFDVAMLRLGRVTRQNLWRLKCSKDALIPTSGLLPYRLIYAPDFSEKTIIGLAIMPKPPENYDVDSPRFRRISREYDQLGTPYLPPG